MLPFFISIVDAVNTYLIVSWLMCITLHFLKASISVGLIATQQIDDAP